MLELLNKNNPTQQNNPTSAPDQKELRYLRKRIALRACLAVLTVLLTVVIVFGMTAAWYTNVVHSGGLIFQVEQMGVNVNATIAATTFVAKPGDSGNIGLEAANNGTTPVDITISINKANMNEEMQKRLYFYVDCPQTRNEETSQRSYVTVDGGYSYRVFGGNNLTLTESYHNDAQLKWCWVYDVLGYYVLGQEQNGTVAVQEYLRPIEYDYDRATFDAYGNLLTVDGTTTVYDFLYDLSLTDGYPGVIGAWEMTGDYYEVDVDTGGYGVYLYLCNSAEVEDHTDYDTALGIAAQGGNMDTYTALLTVNAQPTAYERVTVSTAEDLQAELMAGGTGAIVLSSDVELDSGTSLYVPAGADILLDLNNHTLTTNISDYAFILNEEASLAITGGALDGNKAGDAFYAVGADLTLNDVTLANYEIGIRVADYMGIGRDSTIRLTDCKMDTTSHMILLYGNGSVSDQTTKLFIDNCALTSDYYVISGNGTITGTGRWGTEIEIFNSVLTQDISGGTVAAAIFHPQPHSTLNIYNSQISGYTGMAIKGGTVTITGSNIWGKGTESYEPTLTTSGYADTADAIYVETGYGYDISLTIRNTTASSDYGMGLRVYQENTPYVTLVQEGTNSFLDNTKGGSET